MNNQNKKSENNFDKPFNSQRQLQQNLIDRFAKHGNKVRYQFKLTITS